MEIEKNTKSTTNIVKNTIERYNVPFPVTLAERYSHIVNNMMLFLGCSDFPDYKDKLILNEQNSERVNSQWVLPDAFMEI